MESDSYAQVGRDFEAPKAKLSASVEEIDPGHRDEVVGAVLAFDEAVVQERIHRRYASARIETIMGDIEARLRAGEERMHEGA